MALENQKILFLQGTQAKLDGMTSSTVGAFYLTNDTHRLYLGMSATAAPVPVNQGVTFLANENALPNMNGASDEQKKNAAGQFYFLTDKNILCVYSNNQWVQINSDTTIKEVKFGTQAEADGGVTVSLAITDTRNTTKTADNLILKGNSNVTIEASETTINGSAVKVITFSVPDGDTYSLGTEITNGADFGSTNANGGVGKIILDASKGADTSVNIEAGKNIKITGSGTNNKDIKIESKDFGLNSVTVTPDEKGGEGFSITVKNNANEQKEGFLNPVIKVDTNTAKYVNGTADLSNFVYSKKQVDDKFAGLDAMRYMGTVASINNLVALTDVENGNTYKFTGADIKVSSLTADQKTKINTQGLTEIRQGDVFIARGTEVSGVLVGDWTWDVIPSGDESDTTYKFEGSDTGIILQEAGGQERGTLNFATNDYLSVATNVSADKLNTTVTVNHKELTTPIDNNAEPTAKDKMAAGTANESTYEFVTHKVSVDGAGHVTDIVKEKHTIVDTHNNIQNDGTGTKVETSTEAGAVIVAPTVKMKDGDSADLSFDVASKSLKVTAGTNAKIPTVNIELEWGSF